MKWFEIGLVVLTFAPGIIWLLDRLLFAGRRAAKSGLVEEQEPVVVDYAKAFFPVLIVVLILRSFVAEPFRIPSSSMMPTLLIGDFILVNKFSYGLRLPINNRKVLDLGDPARGDVVVFRFPGFRCQTPEGEVFSGDRSCTDPHAPVEQQDWIKRVIGLPGDTVEYRDNTVYVNGEAFEYRQVGRYEGRGRSLYWMTSRDGIQWGEPRLLSRFELGHYQITARRGSRGRRPSSPSTASATRSRAARATR